MAAAVRKRWKRPEWIPTDMRRVARPADVLHRAHPLQRMPHAVGRAARADGMVPAAEQQQHGVAAPLQQVGALLVRRGQEPHEGVVEDVAHLLGADPPSPREALRQAREAGDVDERERALDDAPRRPALGQPFDQHVGDVRPEDDLAARRAGWGSGGVHRVQDTRPGEPCRGGLETIAQLPRYVEYAQGETSSGTW